MAEGLCAYPKELQKVSGAKEMGSRPGTERLLRLGGTWSLGTVGIRQKTKDKATPFRTSELASLSLCFPLEHLVTHLILRRLTKPNQEMFKHRALQPAITQQERVGVLTILLALTHNNLPDTQ